MLIQLKDIEQLNPGELWAEIGAKVSEGEEGKPNIGGIICHEISEEAARSIALLFGRLDVPGHSHLWELANGEEVGLEYVHDDIDHVVEHLPKDDHYAQGMQLLQALKGWLYLQAFNAPHEPPPEVPEESRLKLSSVSVTDLIGRYVVNRRGAEFKIVDVRYNLKWGRVSFELADLDEDGEAVPGSESGIFNLESFTVL